MKEDIGKYEREALEQQRDELHRQRERRGLSVWDAKVLDSIEKKLARNERLKRLRGS